jgi:hypothetical protein
MLLRGAHPFDEPHHPPVLAVPASVVISPNGPDAHQDAANVLGKCVNTAMAGMHAVHVAPPDARTSSLRCRVCSWMEWTRLRVCADGTNLTMTVFFLLRGGILHVPIYDAYDLLVPCILAQPEEIHPSLVCLLVVPSNVPVGWRLSASGRREACVGIQAYGPASPLRQVYFTGIVPTVQTS